MPATRRHVLKSLALFPIAAAALAAAPAAHAQAIKIGEMNSYKMFPAFLDPYKKGWELAIDEINKSGGVMAKKSHDFRQQARIVATSLADKRLALHRIVLLSSRKEDLRCTLKLGRIHGGGGVSRKTL